MKKWIVSAQLKTGQIEKIESASLNEALETLSKKGEWEKLVAKNF